VQRFVSVRPLSGNNEISQTARKIFNRHITICAIQMTLGQSWGVVLGSCPSNGIFLIGILK
jgi:hypothetical protein